ncbi:MAG: hypothetical protein PHU85_15640 [Phycisphaerae bacterium]|nr:hypothetical protein [Phycisphaerae bacterium]
MPVKSYSRPKPPEQSRLTDRLASEWAEQTEAAEPVILEETTRDGIVHVFVVWSDWASLTREQRGEIIMDAAERVKSKDQLLKITIAMGLTPDEADRFGITWR